LLPSAPDITEERPVTEPEMLDNEAETAEAESTTPAEDDIDNEADEAQDEA
jgi:hypothetical protein